MTSIRLAVAVGIIGTLAAAFWVATALRPRADRSQQMEVKASEGKVVKSEPEWRDQLTPAQFQVCRLKGTERAFTGEYLHTKKAGVYRCVACGHPLFSSETKYDSGTGWPSFWAPVNAQNLTTKPDDSLGVRRVELLCSKCDSHLGHLFEDGPQPTSLRYCINSVALVLDENESR